MPQKPRTEAQLRQAWDGVKAAIDKGHPLSGKRGVKSAVQVAAAAERIPLETFRQTYNQSVRLWGEPTAVARPAADGMESAAVALESEIRTLRAALKQAQVDAMTREAISKHILKIADADPNPPSWTVRPLKTKGVLGVPTLFASDWHWGEVVNPTEVAGANAYSTEIAHGRARKLIERACDLLLNRLASPEYPGIVFPIGGDMVTGTIHDELAATNDMPIGQTVLDLYGVLVWCIETLAERFGRVYVPGVAGNHGRLSKRPHAKERAATNWDWLILKFLEKRFAGDKRVAFLIPDGPDAYFAIYGHRYCLTHGDQFRGGDGITGALMPIMRGRHKKASRDVSLRQDWDTLIMGHWHQLFQTPNVICNGSLKGLDEYAFQNNFGFERAAQACWITHPQHGITFQMPVYVDDWQEAKSKDWVAAFAA